MFISLFFLAISMSPLTHANDYLPQGSFVTVNKTIGLDSKGSPLTIGDELTTQCRMKFYRQARGATIPAGTKLLIKKSTFSVKKHWDSGTFCEPVGNTSICRGGPDSYYTTARLELIFSNSLVNKISCEIYRNNYDEISPQDAQIQERLLFAGLISITVPAAF